MYYPVKTPEWASKLFKGCIWQMSETEKSIFLTFDDGPHPEVTGFVLDELAKYGAKASFFCIGKNVAENPEMYRRILDDGHAVGNHTQDHLNGWKTKNADYLGNILKARDHIQSELFRPPYGRITPGQVNLLKQQKPSFKIIMWTILSGDFDVNITPEQCCKNVLQHAVNGSVVVFHDSAKAMERLRYALPQVLQSLTEKGYAFKKIDFSV